MKREVFKELQQAVINRKVYVIVSMRYFVYAQRALQKCANGQRAFVMCIFCDPFPVYSLNIRIL